MPRLIHNLTNSPNLVERIQGIDRDINNLNTKVWHIPEWMDVWQSIIDLQEGKQDKLTAWAWISIEDNVISNTQNSTWWSILWDIDDQTDLKNALDTISNSIPTNVSDLNNDTWFITNSVNDLINYYLKSETYTKTEVDNLIWSIQNFHYEIYPDLWSITTPSTSVLYLIWPTWSGSDRYKEYVYSNNNFVKIWDTSIDLSWYVTTTDLNTALANYTTTANLTALLAQKQDVLTAWSWISINNNVVSNTIPWATVSAVAPSNPTEWMLWYDTVNDVLKSYNWSSWDEVGSDAPNINTKTFYLSGVSDLTNAQAAYDWFSAGKNPIIMYDNRAYILYTQNGTQLVFQSTKKSTSEQASYTEFVSQTITLTYSSNIVTSITYDNTSWWSWPILRTDINYSTPYTPQFDWSPATKQYVDVKVTWPSSSIDWNLAAYDWATGKLIKDSGIAIADVNTKTFYLSSTSDLTTAQAAYDWFVGWKNPIIIYDDEVYEYYFSDSNELRFANNTQPSLIAVSDWSTSHYQYKTLSLNITTDSITSITLTPRNKPYYFLETNVNYATPYTPTYNGSPATKKYTDDNDTYIWTSAPTDNVVEWRLWYDTTNDILKVYDWTQWIPTWKTYTAWAWISIDSNNEISNAQPWPTVSSTAPSTPSEWDTWYDTTNDALKTYDGSQWNDVSWSWDVVVSPDAWNELSTGLWLWLWTTTDFLSIQNPDSNTLYIQYTTWSQWWQPWVNTIWYYTMNNDILNHATTWSTFPDGNINTATFSTTKKHWDNTHSLYCDGSTYAYLPASSEFEFETNDVTVSCWVYSETNSWNYTWIISNYTSTWWEWDSTATMYWWRLSDRFANNNEANFCTVKPNQRLNIEGSVSLSWWWHNLVVTRINWVYKIYVDWVQVATDSTWTSTYLWRNNNIVFWANFADWKYSKVYLNDVIFEKVWWSATEVSNYYAATA